MSERLAGRQVLVVEDDWFIASYVVDALEAAGARVAGPVPSTPEALEMLADSVPDAATLNVRLVDGDSFPVAERLRAMGVPFLFLSAQAADMLPPRFDAAPRLAKPFAAWEVVEALERLLATAPANER